MKIIMEDEKVERVRQIGRNLAEAAADYEKAEWKIRESLLPNMKQKMK